MRRRPAAASYAPLLEVDEVLYGTTYLGGNGNAGTVFKLNLDGSGFTVLKHFDNSITGGHPTAPSSWGRMVRFMAPRITVAVFFPEQFSKLTRTGAPSAFSNTLMCPRPAAIRGPPASGERRRALRHRQRGWQLRGRHDLQDEFGWERIHLLKNLDPSTEGAFPTAGLIEGDDGKLYGTTLRGGTFDWGIVFEMNPDGTELSRVEAF